MRAWGALAGSEATSHGIDLAPMLDFVVNLLIFFIITAVFNREFGVTVNRPTGKEPESQKTSTTIEIREDGTIAFGGQTVDPRAVRANMERVKHWTGKGAQLSPTAARLVKQFAKKAA